jgi:hypothetical protein
MHQTLLMPMQRIFPEKTNRNIIDGSKQQASDYSKTANAKVSSRHLFILPGLDGILLSSMAD